MTKFYKTSSFLQPAKKKEGKSHNRISALLKSVGGKRGLLLATVILGKPKYSE